MIKYFKKLLKNKRERKQRLAQKAEEVCKEHQKLIDQYKEVQEGKSDLSNNQRRILKAKIVYLIGKGHIKVN